ncbi:hypothetical protein [Roseibium polysiphoniae]|uniref:hypothetical protein n=1 Tax=Roseibium polysiphoniae TaxID=2571221 RepID=UPI00329A6E97
MNRQDIVAGLAERDDLPWPTLSFCLETPAACVPTFLLLLEREARGLSVSAEEHDALFFGIHLLAALRIEEAFKPLSAILCSDSQKAAALVHDSIGDTIPRALMALGTDQADACWDIVASPRTDWLVREAFLRCWTFHVLDGHLSLDVAAEKLRQFPTTVAPEPDNLLWIAWMTAIADLGLTSLSPLVQLTFESVQIEQNALGVLPSDLKVFRDDLEDALHARADDDTGTYAHWLEHKAYTPFSGTLQDFIQAGKHVLKDGGLSEDRLPSDAKLLVAADSTNPFDGPSRG